MLKKWEKLDKFSLLLVIIFGIGSTFVIYSATVNNKFSGIHVANAVSFAVLFMVMLAIAWIDFRIWIGKQAWVLYGLGVLLLLYVRFFGMNINGSRRWINLHVMQFQPSELMKLFVILLLATLLARREGASLLFVKDILPYSLIVGIPFLMVLMQPDLGTSIVFMSIFVGMLWVGNIRLLHSVGGIVLFVLLVGFLVGLYHWDFALFSKIIRPHQMERIQTFLDPSSNSDNSWHVRNSMIGIGAGGLLGEGFLHGYMIHQGFIPYDYADSIFVVIGEEFGFVGCAVLLLLYFMLLYRCIVIAFTCQSLAGRYIVIGICSMLILQIFENIAMHIGLMPLTGIALPFVSYGGSSLLTNMFAMGLVLSVGIHGNNPE